MPAKLPKPLTRAIIYQDSFLYVCLATHPIARGHTVIVWKKDVADLRRLTDRDYDFLMDTVRAVRDAMLKALNINKMGLAQQIYLLKTILVNILNKFWLRLLNLNSASFKYK